MFYGYFIKRFELQEISSTQKLDSTTRTQRLGLHTQLLTLSMKWKFDKLIAIEFSVIDVLMKLNNTI